VCCRRITRSTCAFASEDAAAREISLAENLIREAMTPADEARAYRDIVDGGADAEAVARRFGVTVRHVQGRLRLADLAEPIFAALAAGDITLDVAMAYGSTGDRERQAAAWERLSTSWQADNRRRSAARLPRKPLGRSPHRPLSGRGRICRLRWPDRARSFRRRGRGRWLDGDLAMDLAAKKLAHEAEVAELGSKLAG
jgi:ParB family chromosome partitioning protein